MGNHPLAEARSEGERLGESGGTLDRRQADRLSSQWIVLLVGRRTLIMKDAPSWCRRTATCAFHDHVARAYIGSPRSFPRQNGSLTAAQNVPPEVVRPPPNFSEEREVQKRERSE
ncbi:hypothetical protein KM043_015089 [Ampulex compressa]|nr:hypothetical protein KM043_015089 [Ampulex compressa]